jgi:16S rRNA (uracil1498-N3)-methyltransferase
MHRFYCPALAASVREQGPWDAPVQLGPEESRHAQRVLRLTAGDHVTLFDGQGLVAEGAISPVAGARDAVCVIVTAARIIPAVTPELTVAVALPKGGRVDDMIEQLSQTGVDRVIPMRTRRSVVDARDSKLDRLARAAIESAKQCGRARVMRVEATLDLDRVLHEPASTRLIAAPGGDGLGGGVVQTLRQSSGVLVLIGPEGGWDDAELVAAEAAGFARWTLGPHVMRIETAAVAAAAIVRYATLTQR